MTERSSPPPPRGRSFSRPSTRRRSGPTLHAPKGPISALAVSADKRRIAFGADRTVTVWKLDSGWTVERTFTLSGTVHDVAFSHDGRMLAAAGLPGIQVWDLDTSRAPAIVTPDVSVSVTFLPGDRTLVAGSKNYLHTWDLKSRKELGAPLRGPTALISAIAVSPDGSTMVTGGEDGSVWFWDVATRRQPWCAGSFRRPRRWRHRPVRVQPRWPVARRGRVKWPDPNLEFACLDRGLRATLGSHLQGRQPQPLACPMA